MLQTMQIQDWPEFIEKNDIDLSCQVCAGQGETDDKATCGECGGSGRIEPMWATVWNTGRRRLQGDRNVCGSVFAFEYDGKIWLGLTGCGLDLTPELARAWMAFFPGCRWLPEDFWVTGIKLRDGYVASVVGDEWAKKIYRLQRASAERVIEQAKQVLSDLRGAEQLAAVTRMGRR